MSASTLMGRPWCLHPKDLEKWYNDNIQLGTDSFDRDCRAAVDDVVRYIHSECSSNGVLFDVDRVIKGGSLGKGTMVKDLSDVDLVAFINPPDLEPIGNSSPHEYRKQLSDVIHEMEQALGRLRNVKIIRHDAYLVNFAIVVGPSQRSLEVDLLPTADNFGYTTRPSSIFNEMLQHSGYECGFYSASLVKFQRDFVGGKPGYLKALIRLVKYWAYDCLPENLQKSYPLELITIYCWEEAGEPVRFKKVQGLKAVLQTLTNLRELRHYWEDFYDAEMAEQSITKFSHRNPIMLDPANPSNNACWVYQKGDNMKLLKTAAESTLKSELLCDVLGWPLKGTPWCLHHPRELETWYNDNIQLGTESFDRDCRAAVDEVVRYIQRICSSNGVLFDVDRVIKGGSLGKGTMVKDLSDVDLIAFINPPHLKPIVSLGPARYRQQLKTVIRDLKEALTRIQFVHINSSNDFLVNFTIKSIGPNGRSLVVDLLPTADNCYGHGRAHSDMFRAMLQLPNGYDREFYSASLAEHQLEFLGEQPGYVKELIRLVKYWAYDRLPKDLQKSYPLELITIYRWEKAGKPVNFSKAQGLKDVLQVLTNLRALRHSWTYLYDKALAKQAITQLSYVNPIVLDPANPCNNACWVYQIGDNIYRVQETARATLGCNLLRDLAVSANWRG